MYMYMYMYIYINMYVYIPTHRHAHRLDWIGVSAASDGGARTVIFPAARRPWRLPAMASRNIGTWMARWDQIPAGLMGI